MKTLRDAKLFCILAALSATLFMAAALSEPPSGTLVAWAVMSLMAAGLALTCRDKCE